MSPTALYSIKRTNTIEITIANGQTASDWVLMPSAVVKVLGLKCPTNTPNTTLVFDVREADATSTIYPVASDNDIATKLTLNVNGLGAFGARVLAPLGSFVDGYHEIRLTLGSVITGEGIFILNVPSPITE